MRQKKNISNVIIRHSFCNIIRQININDSPDENKSFPSIIFRVFWVVLQHLNLHNSWSCWASQTLHTQLLVLLSSENCTALSCFLPFTSVWMLGDAELPFIQLLYLNMFSAFQFGWKCVRRLNTFFFLCQRRVNADISKSHSETNIFCFMIVILTMYL